jgi:hypothetical protein
MTHLAPRWVETISRRDDRLPARAIVLGVRAGGRSKAYVVPWVGAGPRASAVLFEDEVGGVPIVGLGAEGVWPVAYDRRTPSGPVHFALEGRRVVDATGSQWDLDGRALNGPSAGAELALVPSHVSEWYAWAANHPDTDLAEPAL